MPKKSPRGAAGQGSAEGRAFDRAIEWVTRK